MADLFSSFTGIGGTLSEILVWLIYILPVAAIIIIGLFFIREKLLYKFPVRIFRIRENGKVLELNKKGRYVGRKNSAPFFKIKMGLLPHQTIDLTTTPNPAYMDEQNRVYFKQIDVDSFVQMKREFNPNKKVIHTPVESDVKYGAILSVQRIKEVLRVEPTWKKILPYFGLGLMAVIFIVAYALLMDKCGG